MNNRAMKDSGIEWMGEIPNHWGVVKLNHKYKFHTGFTPDTKNEDYYSVDGFDWLTIGDLTDERVVFESAKKITNQAVENSKGTISTKGSLLYSFKLSVGQVAIAGKDIYTNEAIATFPIEKNPCVNFLYYSSQVCIVQNAIENIYGAKILNQELIKSAKLPFPPLHEQQAIATYLDEKISNLDRLIQDQQRVIEEWKAYKQSLITETVTKGLNPEVEMKDSGIEWIGEIPSHWEVRKGKYLLTLLKRPVLETDEVITCFRDGEVTLRKNRREEGFTFSIKEIGYQGIEVGDLVIHGMDGFAGAIGISDSRGKGTPILNVCDILNGDKRYFMFLLRSFAFNGIFLALSTGIRVRSCDLRWNKISNLDLLYVPLHEQQQIANFLDEKCSKIDQLIENKQKLIEELKAYKQSLIYECVTGKKEIV